MALLVLLTSPLTGSAAWGRLPDALRTRGADVTVVEAVGDDEPPYALRWVASCALQVRAERPGPVVLVGHSGAGLLLAQLGFALRAAHRAVAAYAFVDAGVPRAGSRLDVLDTEDANAAAELRAHLATGGRFPTWSADDLVADVPAATDREELVHGLRPRDLAYWSEPLPPPVDWPEAPCVYLRTSAGYDATLRVATARGWAVDSLDLGHFPGLRDPDATASALITLLTPTVPGLLTRESRSSPRGSVTVGPGCSRYDGRLSPPRGGRRPDTPSALEFDE
ncbi:MAG TPA: hypothetical protein VEV13_03555 [Candidatus Limnocylindria bacterium]|nr:hypothetical protein [Candidatus Limnocylindria bacterium]